MAHMGVWPRARTSNGAVWNNVNDVLSNTSAAAIPDAVPATTKAGVTITVAAAPTMKLASQPATNAVTQPPERTGPGAANHGDQPRTGPEPPSDELG